MALAGTPFSSRCTTRCAMTRVLPDPAPASTSTAPSVCSTAARCWGFSDERSTGAEPSHDGHLRAMRRIILLWPLLAACSLFQSLASSAVERPSLSFKEAKLPRIDFEGADLNLVFLVTNPNTVGLDLAQADYALDVEGHRVVAGKPANGLKS